MSEKIFIKDVRTYITSKKSGGDYHLQEKGHWISDTIIANPMSPYPEYKKTRTSWGIGVLGSVIVEIELSNGIVGVASGLGGKTASWLIQNHFKRFLINQNPKNLNLIWEHMFRASHFYGRKGLTICAISVVDLAIWDALGILRNEPVMEMIGGKVRDEIHFYCTGPDPVSVRKMGFWGSKVPLPYGPADGHEGLEKNYKYLKKHRESVPEDFPLMVDCFMSLNVQYAIQLAKKCEDLNINWWEEVLHPDDIDGYKQIKQAHPDKKWTTGEHEYTRYGFRQLIETKSIDILQPDVMWVGGMTELLKVSAMAAAYDLPVVPHGSGPYSSHFIFSQPHSPFCEYIAASPDGKSVIPMFPYFEGEQIPVNGKVQVPDQPGFGMKLIDKENLVQIK